jgi:hypothetical protein
MEKYTLPKQDFEYLQTKFENIHLLKSRGMPYDLSLEELAKIRSVLKKAELQR